ncbi:hypothetical protein FMUAM8_28840 [Nocardia cyriacigeorgica]|nr:hypothetical protein FMUAM8_28840 [Nocardia cyriacigeorgica]
MIEDAGSAVALGPTATPDAAATTASAIAILRPRRANPDPIMRPRAPVLAGGRHEPALTSWSTADENTPNLEPARPHTPGNKIGSGHLTNTRLHA